MANWYAAREELKRAASIYGGDRDFIVDRALEGASRLIDRETHRFFIPKTETRLYRWPPHGPYDSNRLWLDQDLISVTTLKTKAQDSSPTTIVAADYFLEPANTGPPYSRIEIDESSNSAWEAGDTSQRSISVLGSWGFSAATKSAGTVSSGLASSAAATSMVCSDASKINVGDALLIETEQIFVSERSYAALGSILINGALTADVAEVTVTVDGSHGIIAGEVIKVDSEEMYVQGVSGNNLTVVRAYNGSTLAAHSNDTAVQINRTLTIERGKNGTTAATHADATAISKYDLPVDIKNWCLAEALALYHQEMAGWGRQIGSGEGARELSGRSLGDLRGRMQDLYRRWRVLAI